MENNGNETLVTLAIHTFERAQILKTLLENEGISVCLHNVNLISPIISAGVRVRIKENDLPKALGIIEKMDIPDFKEGLLAQKSSDKRIILVPVDFSNYSMKACHMAFNLAKEINAEIKIMTAFYHPMESSSIPFLDVFQYSKSGDDDDTFQQQLNRTHADMDNLKNQLTDEIKKGELPDVEFTMDVRQGIPEEEIALMAKEINALMIVMGTRGKDHKEQDLIGSVTAEIIERTPAPIFAIPEDDVINDFANIKNVAFATSLDQADLLAIDQMLRLFKNYNFKLWLLHIQQHNNKRIWNEVKLSGLKNYFKNNYPNIEIEFEIIQDTDILIGIDKFVREKGIDLISLNTRKRNIITRLLNPSIAKRMIFHAQTPMFVLHS